MVGLNARQAEAAIVAIGAPVARSERAVYFFKRLQD